jgi:hypothetical protein
MLNEEQWIFIPTEPAMTDKELRELYHKENFMRDTEGFNWYVAGGISLILLAFVGGCFALKPLISWGLHSLSGLLHNLFQ